MNKPKRYLVTSALPYSNGPLHIGHLAGVYVPADIYVRYLRMIGEDVRFICGSDEHGAAITLRAKKEGITPREIIDKYHEMNKRNFERFGMSFDIYHRTSDPLHHQTSADFFTVLNNKGVFTEKESEQYYDEEYQQFLADRYITGTCPKCSSEGAYGDQCENCGSSLDPTDLINPMSTLSGSTPVLKKTKHWYLPMGDYQEWVGNWIEAQQSKEVWKKHVVGQCRSWLTQGLNDRSMTRDLDWGVAVPLPDAEGKVLYVWLDAPIGYISATKALLPDTWEQYWKDEDCKLLHFLGKDNIVFHCIIFPMILHAHGDFVLPTNVPACQFLNLKGYKMSTSRNLAVWLHEYLDDFPEQEDVLRYVLTVNMPEGRDTDFSWEDFKDRNNKELVGILGNFVNRVLVLIHKYFDGIVPAETADIDTTLIDDALTNLPKELDKWVQRYEFRKAVDVVMDVAGVGNKFLADTEPWKLIKTDKAQTAAILTAGLKIIAYLSVYLEPFLPFTTPKLKAFLNLTEEDITAIKSGTFEVAAGRKINKASLLFKKLDDKAIAPQIAKLEAAQKAYDDSQKAEAAAAAGKTYEPLKPEISYEDFAKLDIRTATILAAEKMKKTDKLLKITLDLGFEQRTVVSGIAQHHQAENIIGQKVLILANLAPRKLRGVESQGMILMAGDGKNNLFFVSAHDAENGEGVS